MDILEKAKTIKLDKLIVLSFIFFSFACFIARDVLFRLKILPEAANFFFSPSYYRTTDHHSFYIGLNLYFFMFYFLLVFLVTLKKKGRSFLGIRENSKMLAKYLLIFIVANNETINPLSYIVFDPIKFWIRSAYGKEISLDYRTKKTHTPWGSLDMQETNHFNDEIKISNQRCLLRIERNEIESCVFYPYK